MFEGKGINNWVGWKCLWSGEAEGAAAELMIVITHYENACGAVWDGTDKPGAWRGWVEERGVLILIVKMVVDACCFPIMSIREAEGGRATRKRINQTVGGSSKVDIWSVHADSYCSPGGLGGGGRRTHAEERRKEVKFVVCGLC